MVERRSDSFMEERKERPSGGNSRAEGLRGGSGPSPLGTREEDPRAHVQAWWALGGLTPGPLRSHGRHSSKNGQL